MKRIKNVRIAMASAVVTTSSIISASVFVAEPSFATNMSNNCWTYPGGSTTTGGCVGNPFGGSNFQVHEWCGWASIEESSAVTYAPANVAVNATTPPCPAWSSGIRSALTNSW